MIKNIFTILLFLYTLNSLGQNSTLNNNSEHASFGSASKTQVHKVRKSQYIDVKGRDIQILESKTNFIIEDTKTPKDNFSNYINNTDGWMTFAYGNVNEMYGTPTSFEVTFIVPSKPKSNNQLIYIFNGLETIDSGVSHIVQPVLQWGISPAGGGAYWGICNWYVNNNQFFYDSLIAVNPGDTIRALIELTSSFNEKYNYRSSFLGYSSGLQVSNLPKLEILYIALETFGADCDDLPNDERIRFRDIRIKSKSENPTITWHTLNQNNCGQYTTIINRSSSGGEIHINFHTPFSKDGFDEVHVYPNPFNNFLHISPHYIKNIIESYDDIKDCEIQIFNLNGSLLYSTSIKEFKDEFDLDLKFLDSGIYFIRFSYNKKDHTFKIIKLSEK